MKPGMNSVSLAAATFALSACASSPDHTFQQRGYYELEVPRSAVMDYAQSVGLRAGDFKGQTGSLSRGSSAIPRERRLILNGAPYISEESRALIRGARIIGNPAPDGLSVETSLGDLADPIEGSIAGAGIVAEAFAQDWPDLSGCESDPVGGLVCGLFLTGVVVTVAAGAVIGAGVGIHNQHEKNQQEKLAEDIRQNLGDVRPLAELIAAFETELRSAIEYPGAPADDQPIQRVRTSGPVGWSVDGRQVVAAKKLGSSVVLSEIVDAQLADTSSSPIVVVGIDEFGLYPVREDGKLRYSLAIISELTFMRQVTTNLPAAGDEIVLTAGQSHRTADQVFLYRRFPVIRPSISQERWATEGSELLGAELNAALQSTVERMVDYSVRLYREAPAGGAPATYRVIPIQPTVKAATFSDDLVWALNPFNGSGRPPSSVIDNESGCLPVEVGTRTPSFTWKQAPRSEAGESLIIPAGQMQYDLRIFDDGLREVARADGLDVPEYNLTEALAPDTVYYWTARARFSLNGEPRVTDWAVCGRSGGYPHVFDETANIYFPFRTP